MKTTKTKKDELIYGKLAPQSLELEKSVIGAILVDPRCIMRVFELIRSEDVFYSEAHGRIFKAIKEVHENSVIDFQTVCAQLRKNGDLDLVGGSYYVIGLTKDVVSSAHIEQHIRIILEHYFKRELIRIGQTVVADSYTETEDIFDTIEKLKGTLADINEKIELTAYRDLSQIVNSFIETLHKDILKKNEDEVKTFIPEYDKVLQNLQGGNLYVIAARTSMGKTGFEVAVTLKQSEHFDVGIWNGELTEKRMIRRYLSNKIGITVGDMSDDPEKYAEKILNGLDEFVKHKLHIDNKRNINIDELCNKIKYWVFTKKCKCIWLDYVQVIKLSEKMMKMLGTKTEQVGYVIDRLNEVSAICDVPIILLAQVNREALKNGNKQPTLGNLRDSGSIEERVYHVSFLHRPEYYGEQEYEGKSTENMMQIIIAKNGDGVNNEIVEVKHDLKFNRIMSMNDYLTPFNSIDSEMPF